MGESSTISNHSQNLWLNELSGFDSRKKNFLLATNKSVEIPESFFKDSWFLAITGETPKWFWLRNSVFYFSEYRTILQQDCGSW